MDNVKKKVMIQATFTYEMEFAADWDTEQIDFFLNDGRWCANNVIEYLLDHTEEDGCICDIARFEVVDYRNIIIRHKDKFEDNSTKVNIFSSTESIGVGDLHIYDTHGNGIVRFLNPDSRFGYPEVVRVEGEHIHGSLHYFQCYILNDDLYEDVWYGIFRADED